MKNVQTFYADQMEAHGYDRKTFNLETDTNGKVVVHPVTGEFNDAYYHADILNKIDNETKTRFNSETDIYVFVVDVSTERIQGNCGIARFEGGPVMVPATGDCVTGEHGADLIAHELGHALNLEHDFRDHDYIMSYGSERNKLSACASTMLNVSPYFNDVTNTANAEATIQMQTPTTYPKNANDWTLRFNVSDTEGVYQVQFLLSVPGEPTSVMSCQEFNAIQRTDVEFDMPIGATIAPVNIAYIRVVDHNGDVSGKSWELTAKVSTETNTTNSNRTETYLTLTYESPDALIPTNFPAEWGASWGGKSVWEKVPNGTTPERPHNGFVHIDGIPHSKQWDYWFYGHVPSRVVYNLSQGNYATFDAYFDIPNPCNGVASVQLICLADNVEIYNTGIWRGTEKRNTHISVDIPEDTQTFTIKVTDAGDRASCDHFIFANAKLLHRELPIIETTDTETIDTDRTETYLTLNYDSPDALVPTNPSEEWAGWLEKLVWEKTPDDLVPRRPNGFMDPTRSTQYYDQWDYFFYSHAVSHLVYDVSEGNYSKFDARFDMPNPCGSIASVEIICLADGVEIYNSGILIGSQSRNIPISFDIPENTQTLTINVTDAGNGDVCDHFIFANAKLLHRESTVIEVDDYNYTDVNNDGVVNIIDLVLVAVRYGEKIVGNPFPNPDVNRDGIVDINDIILVTQDMPPVVGAPSLVATQRSILTSTDWQPAYAALPDAVVDKGIAVLDLLFGAVVPTKTVLLENYPNPFNSETWIPYQLAKPADVVITIRAIDGQVVHRLDMGHREARRYVNRSRAAYWDGRNAFGESVASGLYFYTLTAGKFVATQRMLIRK